MPTAGGATGPFFVICPKSTIAPSKRIELTVAQQRLYQCIGKVRIAELQLGIGSQGCSSVRHSLLFVEFHLVDDLLRHVDVYRHRWKKLVGCRTCAGFSGPWRKVNQFPRLNPLPACPVPFQCPVKTFKAFLTKEGCINEFKGFQAAAVAHRHAGQFEIALQRQFLNAVATGQLQLLELAASYFELLKVT